MNKNTFETLKKFEKHLIRAKGDYVYGLYQNDFDILYEIYKELGGKERLKYSCSNCQLRLLKFIGKYYFGEKEILEKVVETVEPVQEKEPIEEKPKKHPGGRPKGSKNKSRVKK